MQVISRKRSGSMPTDVTQRVRRRHVRVNIRGFCEISLIYYIRPLPREVKINLIPADLRTANKREYYYLSILKR